ncbi:citrate/2-methylcitrate synthase [Lachnotalea glycerini]|uniref:Citrate synthase n=1 Tax=Lachnotalea glycerini TaxID=1763509 RepID=A0A371J160_9FIRM|nr:citrate/2-methylcitrate synthase [Lachnotalea glycerini]RDY26445.1 citrate/2-methylcitrate synthase [Lachnotalea glycerini]
MNHMENDKDNQIVFEELAKKISSKIEDENYTKYSVKRGLRNSDGTGVLVGLTEIGDVRSYIMCEGEKIPTEGKLMYRGLNIMDLVNGFQKEKRLGFEECCYLLLFGKLPTQAQLNQFTELLGDYRELPEEFTENHILKAPSNNLMNKIARSVLTLYSYDDNPDDTSIANVLRQSIQLISRFPILATYGYQAKRHYYDKESLFIHMPQKNLSTAENILYLTRPDSKYTKLEVELLDLALVLHAEHGGGNNSTFTTHVISSTGTDTYSAIAGAIGSLKGPLHGGANSMVLEMIEDFKANIENWEDEEEVAAYVEKVLRKEAFNHSGLIYGMGHAVYTLSDPRAVLLKEKAEALSKEKGMEREFSLYKNIELVTPDIFKRVKENDKVVCANVDFYSGFVYNMLNIPRDLHTPIFVIARIAGWSAHRIEEIISGGRIIRPAYKNVAKGMEYLPMEERY